MHKLLSNPQLADKFTTKNIIDSTYNTKILEYFLQNDLTELDLPEEIIRLSENEWLLKKEFEYQYIFTIEKYAGRMKITMKEHVEPNCILNVYSCSWTFNEIVAKNSFFSKFEDIDSVIEILKNILGNQVETLSDLPRQKVPRNFSFQTAYQNSGDQNLNLSSYDNSFITLTFDILNTNTK